MDVIGAIAQTLAALGILDVWLLRFNKSTGFRGGSAQNMTEEFEIYGFPAWATYAVGAVKITLAILLLVGLFVEDLTRPAAIALAALMVGAVGMHVRVGDPIKKAAPALTILTLSVIAAILA